MSVAIRPALTDDDLTMSAGVLDRLDHALAALALAEAGARLLDLPAAPSWRERAQEHYDAAERAGATGADLLGLLREHGQVT